MEEVRGEVRLGLFEEHGQTVEDMNKVYIINLEDNNFSFFVFLNVFFGR